MRSNLIIENNICTADLLARGAPLHTAVSPLENIAENDAEMPGFVTAKFRALSKVVLENRGIDFTKGNVLKASTSKLIGKPVFTNHQTYFVEAALGAVNSAWWDEGGKEIPPGINSEIKIDGWENSRVARGLTMKPPSINALSVTVAFEFDYSHPQLVEEKRFWPLLGEEVDGQIVRIIATDIVDYLEASLVFRGEDPWAKQLSKRKRLKKIEKKRVDKNMKLTNKQQAVLGLSSSEVSEHQLLERAVELAEAQVSAQEIAELSARAAEGEKLLEGKRAEVESLAVAVEFGGREGELNPVLANAIKTAGAADLLSLETDYRKRLKRNLPENGSSSENSTEGAEQAETQAFTRSSLL
jgi:hypothetical protein